MSIKERSIGRIKWYGGYNSKKGQDNKFGFLESSKHGSIFVHESGLNCAPSEMEEGRWVTFGVRNGERGESAVDVHLAEKDSNTSVIADLLKTVEIPIETRIKACFHIPLEENHPLIQSIKETIAEYDREGSNHIKNFPTSWESINRKSSLFGMLPEQIRRDWFNREYPEIIHATRIISSHVECIDRSTEIYKSMSFQDRQLALSWASNDHDYERSKMLSARGAELAAAEFFSELGRPTQDVAIHQITGESEQWRSHDLLLDSFQPVDIKNARNTINSKVFAEFTIKRFKRDLHDRDVAIVGVLSPYMTLKEIEEVSKNSLLGIPFLNRERITILGATTKDRVRSLEMEFSKREMTVYFGDPTRWPIWIFNNELDWHLNQKEAISMFSKSAKEVARGDWIDCQQNLIPAFVISGMEPPGYGDLLPWKRWYLDKLLKKSVSGGLTLPWLYIFTFCHFLEAVTNIDSSESAQYSPGGYMDLLFHSKSAVNRPACLIDPSGMLSKLIETLNTLWNHRQSASLVSLRNFVFRGEGLLKGTDPEGRKVTVLAYCGGYIEGKGKCGSSPLVIGREKTCHRCQMLICNKCNHCSDRCRQSAE